jgi:nitrogen fixation protein FixH
MAMITVSFFAVVIAVNIVMATFAVRTFGGLVVDNSYVASQRFNGWLDEAHAQRGLGWKAATSRQGDYAVISLSAVQGARVSATAIHPVGLLPDKVLHFVQTGPASYRSVETLPAGRWRLEIDVRHGTQRARFVDEVPA